MDQLGLSDSLLRDTRRIFSRDEMNLAEFPLTVLSTRAAPGVKTLEFSDTLTTRNGDSIERRWIITGADKFGLPTASDDEVLLGLLKLTVESGFRERKIFFTRYELLRALRWTTEGRSYTRLQRALDRLSGVRIKASNAFYDNDTKGYSTRNFGIIDAYEINDGRSLEVKPSFFTWSEVMFKSFQAGFIKKIDLNFYLDLQSAVSKRLYRFLDKHFWYRSCVQIKLFTLAHEKVGISRNYKFASSLRQQLDPALEELRDRKFISTFEYTGRGGETELCVWSAHARPRNALSSNRTAEAVSKTAITPSTMSSAAASSSATSASAASSSQVEPHFDSFLSVRLRLTELLVERGIQQRQVERLLSHRTEAELNRMISIVQYFDRLCSSQSRLVSKSPTGFLYRAIEHPEQFVLPEDDRAKTVQKSLELGSVGDARAATPRGNVLAKKSSLAMLEAHYLTERKREGQRLLECTDPGLVAEITKEVEAGLIKLRKVISSERFGETVRHGVEERLVIRAKFPEFDDWLRLRDKRSVQ